MNRHWIAFAIILGIAGLVYSNTLHGSFLVDDYFFIDRPGFGDPKGFLHLFVESVLPWHKESSLFRPIPVLSMAIQMFLFGKNPIPYHAVNILLHMINTALVIVITQKVFKNSVLAIFSGALFAVLPIHTEAVANIKSRDELFATGFLLLSWGLFFLGKHTIAKIGSIMALFFATLSKEFAVGVFLAFLVISYWKKILSQKEVILWVFYWGLAVSFYALLRYIALGVFFIGDDVHITSNPLKYAVGWPLVWTPFSLLWLYVSRTLVPVVLSATYHMNTVPLVVNPFTSWQTGAGIGVAAFYVGILSWKHTRVTPLGIGIFLFVVSYLPFSQFFFRGGDIFGERWMYFSSLGFIWAIAWGIERLINKHRVLGVLAGVVLVGVYTLRTIDRNRVWQHPQALFASMIRDAPKSIKGYANMAHYSLEQGYYDDAERYAREALVIYDDYAPMYDVLASVSYQRKQYAQARTFMEQALHIDPEAYDLYHNFARILFIQKEYREALRSMDIYIRATPITPKIGDRILFAMLLTKNRKFEESIGYMTRELAGDMEYPEVRFLLAVNHYFLGHVAIAEGYMTWQKNRSNSSMVDEINAFPLPK